MKKTTTAALAACGLLCVLLTGWFWRRQAVAPHPARLSSPAPAAATAASTAVPTVTSRTDPAVRDLLARLQRLLGRRDIRHNEAVLTFKDDAAYARFLARAAQAGLTIVGRLDALRSVRVRYTDLAALQLDAAQHPSDYADLSGNYLFGVPPIPAKEARDAVNQVPFRNSALAFLGATGDRSQWGRGVTIAVLDTGVALADATFGTGRVQTLDVGLGVFPGTASDDGHGTSVASLAAGLAADAPGVAPAARVLSIRVTDTSGTSDIYTLSQAIVAATDAGARVINISLGGYATNALLDAAITYAANNGAVIVAAAGNDQAAQLAWPAADPRVISVAAVDLAEQQVTFSNSGAQLQLSAPGYAVQTAWLDNSRVYVSGTSASAPLVAGAIAAVMSQNSALTAAQAAQILTQTANDVGAPGTDPNYGHGILNLAWAMNATNRAYTDTAVSSHYYDAATGQMDFVLQNRGGAPVSSLSLAVTSGAYTTYYDVTSLDAGETKLVTVPVDAAALKASGQIRFSTTLINPIGTVDQVPTNNTRASVLTATK
ncbi:S8 family serine peptidase [Opitutus sp. ER46]|uniref:S8 family peptidase n=1 Tax=Opitutus sp. ER46 TaxID=2161864 RepID=UPI000D2FA9E9|nr:S8 family serine peptidase [Opitutus sp. ER46]